MLRDLLLLTDANLSIKVDKNGLASVALCSAGRTPLVMTLSLSEDDMHQAEQAIQTYCSELQHIKGASTIEVSLKRTKSHAASSASKIKVPDTKAQKPAKQEEQDLLTSAIQSMSMDSETDADDLDDNDIADGTELEGVTDENSELIESDNLVTETHSRTITEELALAQSEQSSKSNPTNVLSTDSTNNALRELVKQSIFKF